MSRQPHHTVPALSEQLRATIEQGWQEDVVSRLPADYEAQAYQLGAFERERELKRPADVLRALLAYVICHLSFRQLGCWGVLIGMANLSDNAWRKRLRQARAWLFWLLSELLTPSTPVVPLVPISPEVRSVKLIDATRLKQPGGCGDDWRLHIAYDLLAGRLAQVSISDRHGAESFSRFVAARRAMWRWATWATAIASVSPTLSIVRPMPLYASVRARFPCKMSREPALMWWTGSGTRDQEPTHGRSTLSTMGNATRCV